MSVKSKKELVKQEIVSKHGCAGACIRCTTILALIDRMEESNIPMGYWFLSMKDFKGSEQLKNIIEDYTKDLTKNYMEGYSLCFAGNQGTGKTMSSICILKAAIKQNFSAYYITANDMLTEMVDYRNANEIREILRSVDFLVIDELDSRFFPSDSSKELFSGVYENVFRYRAHNTLPTIICTNETDEILNVFYGPSVQSIKSLNRQYLKMYPVAGTDFRKIGG